MADDHLRFLKLNILIWAVISVFHIMILCSIIFTNLTDAGFKPLTLLLLLTSILNVSFLGYCIFAAKKYQVLEKRYACSVQRLLQALYIEKTVVALGCLSNGILALAETTYLLN